MRADESSGLRVAANLSDLKRAEEIRAQYVAIVESSDDAIIAKSLDGVISAWNAVRLTKAGERIDVSLTISPLRDPAGRIVGYSKIARDITKAKQAEAALRQSQREGEERFRLIANTAPVMIWMSGPDKQIAYLTLHPFAAGARHNDSRRRASPCPNEVRKCSITAPCTSRDQPLVPGSDGVGKRS